jgi:hypothetical protein
MGNGEIRGVRRRCEEREGGGEGVTPQLRFEQRDARHVISHIFKQVRLGAGEGEGKGSGAEMRVGGEGLGGKEVSGGG